LAQPAAPYLTPLLPRPSAPGTAAQNRSKQLLAAAARLQSQKRHGSAAAPQPAYVIHSLPGRPLRTIAVQRSRRRCNPWTLLGCLTIAALCDGYRPSARLPRLRLTDPASATHASSRRGCRTNAGLPRPSSGRLAPPMEDTPVRGTAAPAHNAICVTGQQPTSSSGWLRWLSNIASTWTGSPLLPGRYSPLHTRSYLPSALLPRLSVTYQPLPMPDTVDQRHDCQARTVRSRAGCAWPSHGPAAVAQTTLTPLCPQSPDTAARPCRRDPRLCKASLATKKKGATASRVLLLCSTQKPRTIAWIPKKHHPTGWRQKLFAFAITSQSPRRDCRCSPLRNRTRIVQPPPGPASRPCRTKRLRYLTRLPPAAKPSLA